MDHPLPWLRYVDADDVDVAGIEIDGMKVRNDNFEKLGTVHFPTSCAPAVAPR